MNTYTSEQLKNIIEEHHKWLVRADGGARADLNGAKLTGADLTGAYLSEAKLTGAKLTGAKLNGADLTGADLNGAKLNGEEITATPVQISCLRWPICIGDTIMKIGCQVHPIAKWEKFSDGAIELMDTDAATFWAVWRAPILAMCAAHTSLLTVEADEAPSPESGLRLSRVRQGGR